MKLIVMPQQFAVTKFDAQTQIPNWAFANNAFLSITYTKDELSLVCEQSIIPENMDGKMEPGWRCLMVDGELDFSLTGILANLSTTLANANVSIFALSTYNTDYLLVKNDQLNEAMKALQKAGHHIERL